MHHVRTLKILLHVYLYELKKSLLIEEARLERLFLGVEALLNLHVHFLNCLKVRQNESQEEGAPNNYQITQFGDILSSQVGQSKRGEKANSCIKQCIICQHTKSLFHNRMFHAFHCLCQFSGSLREGMIECYSVFCAHHNEAIGFYKEQLQNNKKLQILIRVSTSCHFPDDSHVTVFYMAIKQTEADEEVIREIGEAGDK